jgi:hypothetical protein
MSQMTAEQFVDHLYRAVLFREPDDAGRRHWVSEIARGADRLDVFQAFIEGPEFDVLRLAMRFAPPGHFNSPYPSAAAIEAHRSFDWKRGPVPAIDYREGDQLALLEKLATHYPKLPFGDAPGSRTRYGYVNPAYSYGDGITLFCVIHHLQPRRIIEVGSGHSSCVMLDTVEDLPGGTQITFVEPYADLLRGLLRREDLERHTLHEQNLQECPLSMFEALEAGDILFIDSSHVSKLGSDVHYLMFEVLPALRPGVWVHIHDIFHPFEYPIQWYDEGRAWNEAYVVRAFLQYNKAWQIEHFSSFMIARHEEWYRKHMPLVLRLHGGNIWISKKE